MFTNRRPLALLPLAAGLRALAAWSVAGWVLHDPLARSEWWLVPLQDMASFLFWRAGFFGNTVLWRGRRYKLARDGRLERLPKSRARAAGTDPSNNL